MAELKYFFSYSRKDSDFVLKLAKELREAGANLWLDQLDILGGERWDRAVEEALESCQAVIAVLSPESVASDQVMDEISYALEQKKLVIPVIIQPCEAPFRLRRLHHIDFTANYETGFSQLLKALHLEQPTPAPEPQRPDTHISTEQAAPTAELPQEAPGYATPPGEPHHAKTHTPRPVEPPPVMTPLEVARDTRLFPAGIGDQTWRQRLIGALVGFGIGIVLGVLPQLTSEVKQSVWFYISMISIYGLIWTIPGAICGTNKQVVKAAAIGFLVAGISGGAYLLMITERFAHGIFIGLFLAGPIGALVGAIVGVYRKKRRVT